jgi:SNF2 family DNA or RNA helicase
MLDLVELALESEGIGFLRLDGSVALDKRISIIKSFRNDKEYTVLLASIGSAGVGCVDFSKFAGA